MLVMFDMPTTTSIERHNYRIFVKELEREGFVRIQFSVYVKICTNFLETKETEKQLIPFIREDCIVQSLVLTEKQYANMHFLSGTSIKDVRNISKRLLIL